MLPIEPRQIKLIKIGLKQLGIDDDTYRSMLGDRFGVDSCTRLTKLQAGVFIDELKRKGFKIVPRKRPTRHAPAKPAPRRKGNMVRLASQAQQEKIAALARLIDWRIKDGLTRWLFKRYSIRRVKTAQQAFLAIEGLKKMFEHQMEKKHGKNWMLRTWDDPEVARYILEHLHEVKK